MFRDDVYFKDLAMRLGPVLEKYSTSEFFPLEEKTIPGGYHTTVRVKYGTDEEYPIYIDEVVEFKEPDRGSTEVRVLRQKVSVYLPEGQWGGVGRALTEDLSANFIRDKIGALRTVLVLGNGRFKLVGAENASEVNGGKRRLLR